MASRRDMIGFAIAVMLGIIGVVILLQSGAALITPFNNAGLANSQLCVNANPSCFWNSSRAVDCTANNESSVDTTQCTSVGFEQPLGSFFESTGVMPLILGAVIILVAIVGMIVLIRKRAG